MNFILDENVPMSVRTALESAGHVAQSIRDYIPIGSQDEIVATVSEQLGAILISFDGDFEKIAPRIPDGQRRRFRELSRIYMCCGEYQAAERLLKALSLIELEYQIAQENTDIRFNVWVSKNYIKTNR